MYLKGTYKSHPESDDQSATQIFEIRTTGGAVQSKANKGHGTTRSQWWQRARKVYHHNREDLGKVQKSSHPRPGMGRFVPLRVRKEWEKQCCKWGNRRDRRRICHLIRGCVGAQTLLLARMLFSLSELRTLKEDRHIQTGCWKGHALLHANGTFPSLGFILGSGNWYREFCFCGSRPLLTQDLRQTIQIIVRREESCSCISASTLSNSRKCAQREGDAGPSRALTKSRTWSRGEWSRYRLQPQKEGDGAVENKPDVLFSWRRWKRIMLKQKASAHRGTYQLRFRFPSFKGVAQLWPAQIVSHSGSALPTSVSIHPTQSLQPDSQSLQELQLGRGQTFLHMGCKSP